MTGGGGERLKHICIIGLYIVFLSLSQKFSRYDRSIAFYPRPIKNASMQRDYQPVIGLFSVLFGVLS